MTEFSELTAQEITTIKNDTDNMDTEYQNELAESREDVTVTPRDFAKWIIKKLNDWL